MGKFRKITNIIDAVKWNGDIQELENIEWSKEAIQKQIIIFGITLEKDKENMCLINPDKEVKQVNKGDYIIKEGKEIYMMPGKMFEETYEQVMCGKEKHYAVVNLQIDNEFISKHINEAIKNINKEYRIGKVNAKEIL